MIIVQNMSLSFGGRKLFDDVNLKFTPGNCYGVIGANGAGKSTFLKILAQELDSTSGQINIDAGKRLAMLRQNHFAYEEQEVLKTVIQGHTTLFNIMQEKDQLYLKEDFSDADGVKASELEAEFAELNGWEAEAEAGTLLAGLGIPVSQHTSLMKDLNGTEKVKVLLAQAIFGKPDILLLDEPTNNLDLKSIRWLENYLLNFENTLIIVSHDRYFLNKVCTHMVDIDFGKIQTYVGNYDFWVESSQLASKLMQEQNKKVEEKMKDLKAFIARFSANASKSRQATSRQKTLDKITLEDIKPSSRKYPFMKFAPEREAGNELLRVENLSKALDGEKVLHQINLQIQKGEKVIFIGNQPKSELAISRFFQILAGEMPADQGKYTWGVTTTQSYFPKDNSAFFENCQLSVADWLRQYSQDQTDTYIRGFLGKMLFSGEEALKKVNVLSGGEKVRCMFSRMMLSNSNVLILDGPTNHLDLESITALNNALISFPGTILFSSHDHQFIQTIANRVIEIGPQGSIVFDKQTTYDEYLEQILK